MIIVEEKQTGIKVGDTLKFKPTTEILKMINNDMKAHNICIVGDMFETIRLNYTATVTSIHGNHLNISGDCYTWPLAFFEIPEGKVVKMCDMEPGQTGVDSYGNYVYKLRNKGTLIFSSMDGNYYPSPDCTEKVRLCDLKLTEI